MNCEAFRKATVEGHALTRIDYRYTDDDGASKCASAYIDSLVPPDLFVRLAAVLYRGQFFIAPQLGLGELMREGNDWDDEFDHKLHTIDLIEWVPACESNKVAVEAGDFITRVETVIASGQWDLDR